MRSNARARNAHSTVRGRIIPALAIAAAMAASGCSTFDFLTDNCETEWIQVTWPAAITRGGTTTNVTLSGTVAPGNIDPSQFNLLRQVLATGNTSNIATVVWTVPAFEVNGGYIAFTHTAPLSSGQTEPVSFAYDGGGWGATLAGRSIPAAIAVRADNFTAAAAAGSITAITGAPLRLRIDVTASDPSGGTMRLTGEAQFEYQRARTSCS